MAAVDPRESRKEGDEEFEVDAVDEGVGGVYVAGEGTNIRALLGEWSARRRSAAGMLV